MTADFVALLLTLRIGRPPEKATKAKRRDTRARERQSPSGNLSRPTTLRPRYRAATGDLSQRPCFAGDELFQKDSHTIPRMTLHWARLASDQVETRLLPAMLLVSGAIRR